MRDYKLGNDVYLRGYHIYGIITSVFYYDEIIDTINFEEIMSTKELNKRFPGWKKKPIYVVACYSDEDAGARYMAIHDNVTLTSELN